MSYDTTQLDHDPQTGADGGGPRFPRWLKWGLLGALAVVILGYGAIFLYARVLNDSPDELDEGDLDAALSIDGETTGVYGGRRSRRGARRRALHGRDHGSHRAGCCGRAGSRRR